MTQCPTIAFCGVLEFVPLVFYGRIATLNVEADRVAKELTPMRLLREPISVEKLFVAYEYVPAPQRIKKTAKEKRETRSAQSKWRVGTGSAKLFRTGAWHHTSFHCMDPGNFEKLVALQLFLQHRVATSPHPHKISCADVLKVMLCGITKRLYFGHPIVERSIISMEDILNRPGFLAIDISSSIPQLHSRYRNDIVDLVNIGTVISLLL